MLLEHRLHATRLQSEVALLAQEKVAGEEAVEATMEEISEFEAGVATLEKEMHQLSRIETGTSSRSVMTLAVIRHCCDATCLVEYATVQ
jgi:uncharacterized protein YhaN